MGLFSQAEHELSVGEQRLFKFGEAAIFRDAARILSAGVERVDELIATLPADGAALLKAVTTADAVLGAESVALNAILSAGELDITDEIQAIWATVEGKTEKVIVALTGLAAKLQAEALATH